MKPLGLSMGMTANGPSFHVSQPSPVEDAIWKAVEEAVNRGWTAKQFREEAAECWEEVLREQIKYAKQDLLA